MFMISRRAGERLVIGNEIEIIVTEIRRRTVRLGVIGGASKQVLRGEVHDAIVHANRQAAQADIDETSLQAALGVHDEGGELVSNADATTEMADAQEARP